MYTAEDAARAVGKYYARGEELSAEWVEEHLAKIYEVVETASNKGLTEVEYEVSLSGDIYCLSKTKSIHHTLIKHNYKVAVCEKFVADGPVMKKKNTVFTISWS